MNSQDDLGSRPKLPFRRVKKECVDTIIGRTYVGDWLLFYLLGQNIDSGAYKVTHSHTFNSQTNGIGPFWQKYKNQLVKSRLTFLGYPA